jgi:DNA gyrase subunit A
VYVLRVADVPATTGYGEPVQSLLKFGDGERVAAARLVREPGAATEGQAALPGLEAKAVLIATARGYGFRAEPDLSETTRAGRRLARVGEGDEIVSVEPVLGPVVVLATRRGKMLRFPLDEVAELSGPGRGVILMRPSGEADDAVVGALALPKGASFVAVTPEGHARTIATADVPEGRRAGKGQKVVKRGGVAALRVE